MFYSIMQLFLLFSFLSLEALTFSVADLSFAPASAYMLIGSDNQGRAFLRLWEEIEGKRPKEKFCWIESNDEIKEIPSRLLSEVYAVNNSDWLLGRINEKNSNKSDYSILILDSQLNVMHNLGTFERLCYDEKGRPVTGSSILDDDVASECDELVCCDFNDEGAVIGVKMSRFKEKGIGFLWTPQEGFTYFTDFFPVAINNMGTLVGRSSIKNKKNSFELATFTFTGKRIVKIGTFRVGYPGIKINDRGEVIAITDKGGLLWHSEKGIQSLGQFFPLSINNNGLIVGVGLDDRKKRQRLSLWECGELTELPKSYDWRGCAINDANQIMGVSSDGHFWRLTPLL